MEGIWILVGAVVIALGALLPWLRKSRPPTPPAGGWKQFDDREGDDGAA